MKSPEHGQTQHQQILSEARRRSVIILEVPVLPDGPANILHGDSKAELIVAGTPVSLVSSASTYICDYKQLSKTMFDHLEIPHAKSIVFETGDEQTVKDFLASGMNFVCKPQVGTNGVGVEMNISSVQAVLNYLNRNRSLDSHFLLEEQVEGEDLRLQVVGGKIVAACIREPAYVVGDGSQNIHSLVDERREHMAMQNPANKLDLDQDSMQLLSEQNLNLDSIPVVDQKVRLKKVANMGQGAIAIDVSSILHAGYAIFAEKISKYMNSGYFGLDFLCTDPAADPMEAANALEINARPEWLHHTFSEVRTHDIAKILLDELGF